MTKIFNSQDRFGGNSNRNVTHYDTKGMIKSECSITDSTQSCTKYLYTYDNEKLTSEIFININNEKIETYFLYNLRGLLFEKKVIYQKKITQLTRYFYE